MAVKKSLLQEAIAEAKTIRETAIRTAYKTLEENITPSIKEMLAKKLDEDVDLNESEEENDITEDVNAGFTKVTPKKTTVVKEEEDPEEENEEEPEEPEESEEPEDHEEPDGDEDGSQPSDHDGDEPGEELADDTPISDLTVGELKDLIASIAPSVPAEPAPEGDLGADMDPGTVGGMGDEETPVGGGSESGVEEYPDGEDNADSSEEGNGEDDDDEIDLSELLKELENEANPKDGKCPVCDKPGNEKENLKYQKLQEEVKKLKKDLTEAYSTVSTLRSVLAETNLLNSKLQYTLKLTSKNLSESQKAQVIRSLDGAKNIQEVKVIYKTLCESLLGSRDKNPKAKVIREHRSTASRSAGKSTAPATDLIVETDFVRRMQQLAGIIK